MPGRFSVFLDTSALFAGIWSGEGIENNLLLTPDPIWYINCISGKIII